MTLARVLWLPPARGGGEGAALIPDYFDVRAVAACSRWPTTFSSERPNSGLVCTRSRNCVRLTVIIAQSVSATALAARGALIHQRHLTKHAPGADMLERPAVGGNRDAALARQIHPHARLAGVDDRLTGGEFQQWRAAELARDLIEHLHR